MSHNCPVVASTRLALCQEVGRLMAYYSIGIAPAVRRALLTFEGEPRHSVHKGPIHPASVEQWFKQSRIVPHSETHITDGLTDAQVSLFRELIQVPSIDHDDARRPSWSICHAQLIAARARIADPSNWIKGSYAPSGICFRQIGTFCRAAVANRHYCAIIGAARAGPPVL